MDPRKAFVLGTLAGAIAPPDQKDAYIQYLAEDPTGALAKFLDDPSCSILSASVSGLATGQMQLQLSATATFPDTCEYQVVLTKLRQGPVTSSDIPSNISISTMSHSPLASLYHSLRDVYGPMMDKREGAGALEPHLVDLLGQVQMGLGAAVRKGTPTTYLGDPGEAPLQGILTPLDEVTFWAEQASAPGAAPGAGNAIAQVAAHMEGLRAPFNALHQALVAAQAGQASEIENGWEAVKEIVDQALAVLRQVWPIRMSTGKFAMSQRRVDNFLHVLGTSVAAYISTQLGSSAIWTCSFNELKSSLIGASQVVARLATEARGLTQDWLLGLDTGGHAWEGAPYTNQLLSALQGRLEEVYQMREAHDELSRLLGPDEAAALGTREVFQSLAPVNALRISDFSAPEWLAGKEEYERRMAPIEQRLSQKLRELFGSVIIPGLSAAIAGVTANGKGAQPQQVFQELKRYGSLLSRPIIAATLAAEKDALAAQIDRHLEGLQAEFDSQRAQTDGHAQKKGKANGVNGHADDGGHGGIVSQLMWALRCLRRLARVQEVVALVLGVEGSKSLGGAAGAHANGGKGGDSSLLRNCAGVAAEMSKEVEAYRKDLFEAWEDDVHSSLTDMASWKSSRLMTFDSSNLHVKTHFNDHLVVLLREVRQLQSLGFIVKREILTEVETANKFYRYGMVLKQRANFYNNIATEMVPCQKPMLKKDAIEFEKVLMNPKDGQGKDITWRNAAALEGYVRRLNEVADRLADKNRQLRKWHDVMQDKVVTLMGTDLVRYKDRWAAGIKEMRDIFGRLEAEGYDRESQMVWRQHWDFQLYKALEYQYMQGLECINRTLPEQEVRMVFRQHKLQYDPPLEELRIRHYKDNLNTFLGLPLRMKGVSDLSERPGFFRPIVDAVPGGMARVYAAAEALFVQLADELKKYQDWMVLGMMSDLDEYVDEALSEVSDWELNFKVLKAAARDAEKLPNEVKIDCYTVTLLPVKAAIDEHMKKLQEALVASLRRKAVAEREQIEEYMKSGRDLFTRQAASVEDIGKAGQEARTMVDGLSEFVQVKRRIEEKNKLLRAMAAGTGREAAFAVVDLTEVNASWEAFTTQLQQFDAHLEEQKGQLGQAIQKQLDEFKGKVAGFGSRWSELKPRSGPSGNPAVVLARIEETAAAIAELREESARLQKEAEAFQLEMGDFQILDEVAADVATTKAAWDRYAEFLRERNEMAHRDWLSMRDQVWKIEDFLTKWGKSVEGKGADDPVALILKQEVDTYRRCLPHLKTTLRGAGWEENHWLQLFQMIGLKTAGSTAVSRETVTLAHFLDVADALVKNADAIKALDAQAQGEALIRKALVELKVWGLQREFTFTDSSQQGAQQASSGKRITLIKEWRDVLAEVGDHQSLVASLRQSGYYHMFKDEVASWEAKLGLLQEGLTLLNQVQRRWVYLEPIFGRGALPSQQARFRNVDEEFRRIMAHLEVNKLVVSFADIPGIRDRLPQMAQQLDVCQRALSDFLEDKRSSFPRFYFLGDDDLLEILGQSKNPTVIQSHLKKLFAGIHKVSFTNDAGAITAMSSMEQEVIDLTGGTVRVGDSIESWLADLAKSMRSTLALQLEAVRAGKMGDEFRAAASQTLCLKEALSFTESVEGALRGGEKALGKVRSGLSSLLSRLAAADYTGVALLQLKKQALIIDLIHYLDVIDQLEKGRASSSSDWVWMRQLRYYVQEGRGVAVAMAEAQFQYTWEYLGNAPKLVYTPLTDKCYLTLTQGMALGYGGNPYGPAGTGKTESVKALGQALGRQVLVFNCDEEFDFKAMGRIFVGLVKCGAWGCFDEFNRLDEEVLSAVSQQIQVIQGALKEGARSMTFMDKTINVDANAGIFVTLNPAGKGYGGRSKLPDNLKQLFRSIAMSVPDNDLIAEVLLVSEGFNTARDLARKMVSLFQLSRELLSPQQHYDWGLRALKTSLGIAGRQLRDVRKAATAAGGSGNDALSPGAEAEIVVRAVCATKLPTLTFDDNRRFRALLGDLFPGVQVTDARNADLEAAIAKAAAALNLELTASQVEKMLQLHLACEQRIGVIIVGPSGSGKSTLWGVLERAYEQLGRRPVVYRMNPKAMARQQLLGSLNLDTREWSDGVLTAAARRVVKEPLDQRSWIVCDGDVDPEWIESLNSVLDDNRLLTMPNGERIQFANNVNFIFECHSLEFASPATVSRCGILYLSDEALDVERLLARWLKGYKGDSDTAQLGMWFKDLFHRPFGWALSHPSAVETTKVGMLDGALSHLAMGAGSKRDFVAGLARGLGANMGPNTRGDFLNDLARMTGESGGLLDPGAYGGDPLSALGDELREAPLSADGSEGSGLVITQDVAQNLGFIVPWLKNREPFLLVGPEGCGKSTLLEYCFSRLMGVSVAVVNCSAQTSASNVIQKLMQVCGKPVTTATGKCLSPPGNSRVILYLKDINLPQPDKYNTSQLVSFLQQLLTHGGYYDDNLDFINIDRVQIVGSMSPPSAVGRAPLSTRFTARVRILSMTFPEKDALQAVYTAMVQRTLHNTGGVAPNKLAQALLEVYSQVRDAFTLNDHPHYQFNPRDVTEWVAGLSRYSLDDGLSLSEAVAHEGSRVFRDRLVGREAQQQFDGLLASVLAAHLGYRGDAQAPWVASTLGASAEDRLSRDPSRVRLAKWGMDDFQELVGEKLKGYEREHKEINITLFPEVLRRIARFDRALSRPGGSLLLAGPCGAGRRSCMLLLAYMHHLELFTPKMTRTYDAKSFRNDLKEVLRKAGVEDKPIMLLLEDHQLVDSSILEAVNSLLSGGEVPGLFTPEELAKELGPLELARDNDSQYTGPPNTYAYYTYRIARNLHIVVSLDPASDAFRGRCESNPALLTRCCMQWLEAWDDSAAAHIAQVRLREYTSTNKDLQSSGSFKSKDGRSLEDTLVSHMVWLHNTMSPLGATPRQYVTLVGAYARIYAAKRKEVLDQQRFLKGGLSKLAEAEGTVDGLSRDAEKQRGVLKVKQAEADDALVRIQASMMQAAERRQEVERLKKQQAVQEKELQGRRGGVEAELAEVQPLIDQARKAVGQIKKENIDEIRSLKMPPEAIRDVLEGVLLVLGQEDTSWNNMKKFLGAKAVKDEIVNYDARKITHEIRSKVERLLTTKGNSFEQQVIYRVSVAAAPLAAWVRANMAYSKVLEKVAPLEAELQGLVDSLKQSSVLIGQYEAELAECDATVTALKNDFAKKTAEAETLRAGLEKAEGTLQAALNLLDKLSGEKGRWVSQVSALQEDLDAAPLSALLTAAFLTYLPGHPEDVRTRVQKEWTDHLSLPNYSLTRFMSSESEMLQWKAEGLPADLLSLQNAVVILNSQPIAPLVIDPSTQASEWLVSHLKAKSPALEVTTLHDPRFANTLELAVRFGKTLVVREVDRIEPLLVPLLRHDLERQGPRFVVGLGDKLVDFNDTFRLYLVTRNPEPVLPPDMRPLVAVVNFTVTRSGLEGQLLGLTLQHEQPELEEKKSGLLRQEEELRVQLAELERSLLQTLATSTGNLLDNKDLLDSLNAAKAKSTTVQASLTHSKELQSSLDAQREVYRPVAQRGSAMYFLIRDLSALNNMYQTSLSSFLAIFRKSLSTQDGSAGGDVTARIALLCDALLELVMANVSRSLFNIDRLTFGMHMARHLVPSGAIRPEEWSFFLGRPGVDLAPGSGPQKPSWVRQEASAAWSLLAANFPTLVTAADLGNGTIWGPWATGAEEGAGGDSADAPAQVLPPQAAGKVTPFQALVLTLAFRPDRLQTAMNWFVRTSLRIKGVAPPAVSLRTLIETESSSTHPVLLLTTPGADPSAELSEYAATAIGKERFHEIAMGQGQAERALQALREAARNGDWLLLKNLHLAISWLGVLEKEVYTLNKAPTFRLFLTSEPHPRFPATLLEASLKVTFEAPPGLKRNLQRTYEGWDADFISSGPPLRAQLLFVLAWFHAVVQERRSYIPQGWSQFYEFSPADLRSGADVVGLATRGGSTQWQMLHGLLENTIYGGRVDNKFDAQVLRTYLVQYFSPEIVGSGGGKVRALPGCRAVVPTSAHRQDYLQVISALPEADTPALFSLPANIGRSAQQTNSERVVAALKAMSVARDVAARFSRSHWQAALGPLLKLWDTLMSSAGPLKAAAKELRAGGGNRQSSAGEGGSPVVSFVELERSAAVTLIETVNATLAAIGRLLRGQDTLSPAVQSAGGALLADTIPSTWSNLWEGPPSPAEYIRAVVSRGLAIEGWWGHTSAGTLLTSGPLDLSSLLRPGTFLNALRQQTARSARVPLDELRLATCWEPGRMGAGAVQIGGLQIQGAAFDGNRLTTVTQDAPTSCAVPPMFLAWVPKDAPLPYTQYITTPLYMSQDRSRVLAEVQVPLPGGSDSDAAIFTLAGMALFLAA